MTVIDTTGQPFEPGHPFHGGTQIIFGGKPHSSSPKLPEAQTTAEVKSEPSVQCEELPSNNTQLSPTKTTTDKEQAQSRLSSMLLGRRGPLPIDSTSKK